MLGTSPRCLRPIQSHDAHQHDLLRRVGARVARGVTERHYGSLGRLGKSIVAPMTVRQQRWVAGAACGLAILMMPAPKPLHGIDRQTQAAQVSAVELLIGSWDAESRAAYGQDIIVERRTLTIGKCRHVRYTVIRDRTGHGPGPSIGTGLGGWREIALELMPSNVSQAQCLHWRVIDFSIPAEMQAHADVALFTTRADFDKNSDYSGWGVWVKFPLDGKR